MTRAFGIEAEKEGIMRAAVELDKRRQLQVDMQRDVIDRLMKNDDKQSTAANIIQQLTDELARIMARINELHKPQTVGCGRYGNMERTVTICEADKEEWPCQSYRVVDMPDRFLFNESSSAGSQEPQVQPPTGEPKLF